MILAIIPARGGSKRIPGKNIKCFNGQALITYPIKTAIDSQLFSEVMVSTDDLNIKDIAISQGAKVPFLRSVKNSNDHATTAEVIQEVLADYAKKNLYFEYFCCIYPTSPLLNSEKLREAAAQFFASTASTMVSICRFSYPIQRALKIQNTYLTLIHPEHANTRSQDLEPCYHDAGQFYWGRTSDFLKNPKLFTANSVGYELSELEVQDIDTMTDWEIAELKYHRLFNKRSNENINQN